jgi:translation elongation factor EF-Tu-like GTPase
VTRQPFGLSVEDVFTVTGRGIAVAGVHVGGPINSGDAAVLVDRSGSIDVPSITVEMHAPPGKLCIVLHGVSIDVVHPGQRLEGPSN